MGEVIRKGAAAGDIFADVRSAHHDGIAKGGKIKTIVEEEIGPMVVMIDTIDADLADAEKAAAPKIAAIKAENERADDLLARTYDDLWNDLGRPGHDRALSLIFPGGIGYYADGDTEGQPDRMELLAQLLERGMHPKLTKAQAHGAAKKVRDAAESLRAVVDDGGMPIAKLELFQRIRTATARAAQFELASLKRSLKNAGFTEAEIHSVIPDRSSPAPKKADKPEKAAPKDAEKAAPKDAEKPAPNAGEKGEGEPK